MESKSKHEPTKAEQAAMAEFRQQLNQKLRTPLNAIMGFAELLLLQPSAAGRSDSLQHIVDAARELLEVIERELGEPGGRRTEMDFRKPSLQGELLYIEDEQVNFTLVERILETRPSLHLLHAKDGRAGLEMARDHQPHLILLDLNLPDIHGSEVLRFLQHEPKTAQIPVVVISADATPSQIERLLAAGARNYLTKPFAIDTFLAVIDGILENGVASQ
jgi:CheY-like chemotaxis protein